ncbi:uncharacterized protein LOC128764629 [Synchiropus splendidus]|uniref:uncharacterized protein LOC128764629 n=1 Tax=Synchiropus splendidus TaxID=270530 RepID=UPI00237E22E6|nr:uncharacterized protein LOC128764629 [Synchiropus splendidus]
MTPVHQLRRLRSRGKGRDVLMTLVVWKETQKMTSDKTCYHLRIMAVTEVHWLWNPFRMTAAVCLQRELQSCEGSVSETMCSRRLMFLSSTCRCKWRKPARHKQKRGNLCRCWRNIWGVSATTVPGSRLVAVSPETGQNAGGCDASRDWTSARSLSSRPHRPGLQVPALAVTPERSCQRCHLGSGVFASPMWPSSTAARAPSSRQTDVPLSWFVHASTNTPAT